MPGVGASARGSPPRGRGHAAGRRPGWPARALLLCVLAATVGHFGGAGAQAVQDVSPSPVSVSYGSACSASSPYNGSSVFSFSGGVNATFAPSVLKLNFNFWASNSWVEFWVSFSTGQPTYPSFVSRDGEFSFYAQPLPAPALAKTQANLNASSGALYPPSAGAISDSGWHHCALSYNSASNSIITALDGAVASYGLGSSQPPVWNTGASLRLLAGDFATGGVLVADLRLVHGAASLPYGSPYSVPVAPVGVYASGTTALLLTCLTSGPSEAGVPGTHTGYDIVWVGGQARGFSDVPLF